MHVVLQVRSGPDAPRSFVIEPGREVRVGRIPPAQVVLANDPTVSRQHFALLVRGETCLIRDLGSTHGTTVNGEPVMEGVLVHGDVIAAGTTVLDVVIAEDLAIRTAPLPSEVRPAVEHVPMVSGGLETLEHAVLYAEPTVHDQVLDVLRSQKEPLFAILDAARDPVVYLRIHECPEQKQSLYEGPEAARLAFVAPYLISLPKQSPFLEQLVHEGWGKSWGVYLTCDKGFEEVRKHLRHFLTVELEGSSKPVLFRFYDPRVLRVFLPTCTPKEVLEFFGPITRYVIEAEEPTAILQHRRGASGLESATRSLEGAAT
jgi:pSer/pThr/pTyr-binding forkhead associated (FHA) protein